MNDLVDRWFVSTTFAPDGSGVADVLASCKRHDIRNVELGSNHAYTPQPAQVLRLFDMCYLVHNYFPIPSESFVLNVASPDDTIRRRSVTHVKRAIDFCAATGAMLYTFHPGFLTDPAGASTDPTDYDFKFGTLQPGGATYEEAFGLMVESIDEAVAHARTRGVTIAIETEGSVKKADHLLMQRPAEFLRLLARYSPSDLRVSLNIGHLRLAANAFGFSIDVFINQIEPWIVAMELSHNGGMHDEHKPLQAGEWYWPIITAQRFSTAFKILEFRNTPVEHVVANLELCRRESSRSPATN